MNGRRALLALGCIVAAAVVALVVARPERVPDKLVPPERSAEAQAKPTQTSEPTTEAVDPDPQDELPKKGYSLTRMDLEQGMLKVRQRALGCRDEGTPLLIPMKVMIAPSGAVASVSLPPEVRGTPVAECISRAVHQATFPAWSLPPLVAQVEWDYPLRMDAVD
ncbi:MAG: hypothetical protein ABI321_17535 [Polyangia bacterium]